MKENTPTAAPRAKAFDSAAYKNWARQEGASWLASRHRDASSLLAAWDLIGDATLLMEAARRFPQDPVVCQAMVDHLMQARATPAEQTRWVDQFIAAAPDNPEGYYLRARLFAEEKNLTGTMEALKEALSKTGRPDHYSRDHAMAVKEGPLASGASVADACLAQRCAPIRRAENTGVSLPVCRVTHFFMDQMEEM